MRAVVDTGARHTDLSPLPMVHARYREEYSFERLAARYEGLSKEPLLVRATLGTPYVPAEPGGSVHLDALLSSVVLDSHARAPVLPKLGPDGAAVAAVPLPLELAWAGEMGEQEALYSAYNRRTGKTDVLRRGRLPARLPLWVCSDLRPQGDAIRSEEYWHKRYPESQHDEVVKSRLPNTRRGRWKEYRVPLSTVQSAELRAMCIGNGPEVLRLLSMITHLGKKGGMGFGRVLRWQVSKLEQDPATVRQAALNARPVPARYVMEAEGEMRLAPGTDYGLRGWTSPYWYAPHFELSVVRE